MLGQADMTHGPTLEEAQLKRLPLTPHKRRQGNPIEGVGLIRQISKRREGLFLSSVAREGSRAGDWTNPLISVQPGPWVWVGGRQGPPLPTTEAEPGQEMGNLPPPPPHPLEGKS